MSLTRNHLKLTAIFLMLIDHTGIFLLDNNLIFREIGRLSFPIFLYLLLDGFRRTKGGLAGKLIFWYAVSIVPYSLAFYGVPFSTGQNIFLTLYICFCVFCILEKREINLYCRCLFVMCFAFTAELLQADYGWYAVALAVIFYYFENEIYDVFLKIFTIGFLYGCITGGFIQSFAALSAVFLPANGELQSGEKPDKLTQTLTYAFYPLHLLFFAFLRG